VCWKELEYMAWMEDRARHWAGQNSRQQQGVGASGDHAHDSKWWTGQGWSRRGRAGQRDVGDVRLPVDGRPAQHMYVVHGVLWCLVGQEQDDGELPWFETAAQHR